MEIKNPSSGLLSLLSYNDQPMNEVLSIWTVYGLQSYTTPWPNVACALKHNNGYLLAQQIRT